MFTRHYPHWPPGMPYTLEVPTRSVYMNLAAGAAEHPDTAAVYYDGTEISYARLQREADALAGYLQQRCGVRKGDRVLLYLQNSPQFVVSYYAILRADAVVVPVNPMNLTEELKHYVEDADAEVAIAGQDRFDRIAPLLGHGLRKIIVAAYSDYLETPHAFPLPASVSASRQALARKDVALWNDALAEGCVPA